MRCYLFNLFSKALFCIFGHANQSHIREWVAQKIISDFACIKCTIACRSWPLPSTYFFFYSPLLLLYSSLIAPAWVLAQWKIISLCFLHIDWKKSAMNLQSWNQLIIIHKLRVQLITIWKLCQPNLDWICKSAGHFCK